MPARVQQPWMRETSLANYKEDREQAIISTVFTVALLAVTVCTGLAVKKIISPKAVLITNVSLLSVLSLIAVFGTLGAYCDASDK